MTFLDRIAAVLVPGATAEQRAKARERLAELAVGAAFAADILDQHQQIEALFARTRHQTGPQAQSTVRQLALRLNAHCAAEEAVIYPAIWAHSSKADAAIAFDDHGITKLHLAALQELEPGSPPWHDKLDKIESAVQQHAYQEEDSWLPALIRFAPVDLRQRLSLDFREFCGRFGLS